MNEVTGASRISKASGQGKSALSGERKLAYYPIPRITRLTTAAVSILSCTFIPVSLTYSATSVLMSLLITMVCGVYFFMTSKNRVALAIAAAAYVFSITLFRSPVIPSMILGLIITVGACSFLIDFCDGFSLCCLCAVPIISFALSWALTKDPLIASCSLLPCPIILCQGLLCRQKHDKKSTVCITAAVAVAMLVCLAAIFMLSRGISIYSLPDIADGARSSLANFFVSQYEGTPTETLGGVASAIGADAADSIFNILPALTLICALSLAYLAHSYHFGIRNAFEAELPENESAYKIRMSVPSALLFLAAFVCSFTTDAMGKEILFSCAAENLYLILLPGLALNGGEAAVRWLGRTRVRLPFVVIGALILFSSYFLVAAMLLTVALALLGAADVIIKSAAKWSAGKETGK